MSSLRTTVSIDVDTFVSKLLFADPVGRYQTYVVVVDELQRLLQNRPIVARQVSAVERVYRLCKAHYIATAVSLAGATVLIVLLTQLLIAGIQLRKNAVQLEVRATDLASINDRLTSSVTSSRLYTVQDMLARDRSHSLKLLEDEVEFPPDGRGFSWKFLHEQASETVVELSELDGGFGRIQRLAFSPSGEHLVVCSKPFDVSIVNLQTQQLTHVTDKMRIGSDAVFMPDQMSFLCQNQHQEVLMIGLLDGRITKRFKLHEPIRQSLAVISDGQFLLGVTDRGSLLRMDFETGEYLTSDEWSDAIPVAIWLTPGDHQAHVVRRDASWEKWDVADLQVIEETSIRIVRTSNEARPLKVLFAAANFETGFGLCIAFALDNGICMAHWPNQANPYQAAHSYMIARSSSPRNRIRFRLPNECVIADLNGGKVVPLFAPEMTRNIRQRKEAICAAVATSDGKIIATGSLEGDLKLVF